MSKQTRFGGPSAKRTAGTAHVIKHDDEGRISRVTETPVDEDSARALADSYRAALPRGSSTWYEVR